ncbi:hypothetical protein [Cupriavidus alkaliphilus]|uniref:Uncharacterized protein n=1 Tax=Cupriavidus alkaliphilus TaxID=942866 RepID=A0A7W4YUG1_9BURK|nr:hypothetical protein [Cupriavidus alkaliphilus]MBB3010246.1 hypothetical protein [Cupriavidus alkaliphilus]
MRYFEENVEYESVPRWVRAALNLAYRWREKGGGSRRIGLLSMPCESEVAGLIALGALRRDLECATANCLDSQFDLLLEVCRDRVGGSSRNREPSGETTWDVRNTADGSCWNFVSYEATSDQIVVRDHRYREFVRRAGRQMPNPNGACLCYIGREQAMEWQLHGFAPPEVSSDGSALDHSTYSALPDCDGTIHEANLRRSYSGLILVGQGGGRDSAYMQKFYSAGFQFHGQRLPLGELLTLHHNERKCIQRLRFVSQRAHKDEQCSAASLVVADGITAFRDAERLFPASDIIGVCNRDASPEAVDQLRSWLNEGVRYYSDTNAAHFLQHKLPSGMLLRVLQQRRT